MNEVISKTEQTKAAYTKRALQLQQKATKEYIRLFAIDENQPEHLNEHGLLSIDKVASFACEFWAPTLSKATWRQYRSALIHFGTVSYKNGVIKLHTLNEMKLLLNETKPSKTKYNRTSTIKKKYLNEKDLESLTKYLKLSKSIYADLLINWLSCNILVGLRPSEWRYTALVDKPVISLEVRNAKNTNGRSHGNKRIISLKHLSNSEIHTLVAFTETMKTLGNLGEYEKSYNGCRRLLQRANKSLWPKRKQNISLYSTRHQFSANLKINGSSLSEIAYLMGHGSTDTATHHYGKKRNGKIGLTPTVNPILLKGIKQKFTKFKFPNTTI